MSDTPEQTLGDTFGVVLRPSSRRAKLSEFRASEVEDLYKAFGAIVFTGFNSDLDGFEIFSSRFATDFVVNGNDTRDDVAPTRQIQTVNRGDHLIPLHAEMAYSPARPEILFFLCVNPPRKGWGETLLCDGVHVWNAMAAKDKTLFERSRIRYRFTRSRMIGVQCSGDDSRLSGDSRVLNYHRYMDGNADLDFVVSACHKAKHLDAVAFANSLLVETQAATFEDGAPITERLRQDMFVMTARLSRRVTWTAGDVLMVDNSRLMHGRRRSHPHDDRRLVLRMGRERFA
jgi:alpha-ketoglutarate-dependent taurine dioxygenase